jgi:hypothetical protein
MASPVTRQKGYFTAFQGSDDVGVRRFAERRIDTYFFVRFKTRHTVQAATADDPNLCFPIQS